MSKYIALLIDAMNHLFLFHGIRVSKAPSGHNRHKYVCLQVNLQHHILCSVSAKSLFDILIFIRDCWFNQYFFGYLPVEFHWLIRLKFQSRKSFMNLVHKIFPDSKRISIARKRINTLWHIVSNPDTGRIICSIAYKPAVFFITCRSGLSCWENDGIYRTPTCILRITDSEGREILGSNTYAAQKDLIALPGWRKLW